MRSPLVYLTVTKLKNMILGIIRKPSQLISSLFLVAVVVVAGFAGGGSFEESAAEIRDINEFSAICFAFFTMMFLMIFMGGYTQGASIFTMSDVNMLFTSPIDSRKILFYGLVRQLGSSLLVSVFLIFQYSWLHSTYDISYGGLVIVILGYAMTVFLGTFTATTLFSYTSSSEKAKRIVKSAVYILLAALLLPAAAYAAEPIISRNYAGILPVLIEYASMTAVRLFPVSGWISSITASVISGNYSQGVLFVAILLVFVAVLIILIMKNHSNYYEDILSTTEMAQSVITAQKEGKTGEIAGKNIRLGKTGIGKGEGAAVIYNKHTLENRRAGFLGIGMMSLITVFIGVAVSLAIRSENFESSIVIVLILAVYMKLMTFSLGRFSRELSKPYVYLIPEPSLKKIYYSVKESVVSSFIESCLIFIICGIILNANIVNIVVCIFANVGVTLVFLSAKLVTMRWFGSVQNKILVYICYYLLLVFMLLPGIALAVIALIVMPQLLTQAFLPLLFDILLNFAVSFGALFLCKDILQYAELN